jgi:signal transduction histidine kinase
VITRLRDLLGKHVMEKQPLDLNDSIADVLRVVAPEALRRGITITTDLASRLPSIVGDRVHLQQVVLNLVLNGMDAMSRVVDNDRRITVTTVALPDAVEVRVADSGPGIEPAIAPRLFDSFVTTKAHGMGLGLSIARTIVEAHGGSIGVVPGAARGAVFRFSLPLPQAAMQWPDRASDPRALGSAS